MKFATSIFVDLWVELFVLVLFVCVCIYVCMRIYVYVFQQSQDIYLHMQKKNKTNDILHFVFVSHLKHYNRFKVLHTPQCKVNLSNIKFSNHY